MNTENKILSFFKLILNKYKKWNGINIFFISVLVFISLGIILNSSFILNNTDIVELNYSNIKLFFNNYLILIVLFLLLYGIVGNTKFSLIFTITIFVLVDIVNQVVFSLRGTAFAIADIFSFTTALTVTNGLEYKITEGLKKYIVIFVSVLVFLIFIKFRKKNREKKIFNIVKRIISIIVSAILISISIEFGGYKTNNFWNLDEKYKNDGVPVSIVRQLLDFNIEKPEGYSIEKVKEILSRYSGIENNNEKVNIITVVNESFADLNRVYELGLESNMPFFDSLYENSIKGTLYSSTIGGGTATVEWEFLTGNSAAYIPENSIPFISYSNNIKQTLLNDLKEQNYYTFAVHPFHGKCYNRNITYPKIGFIKSMFLDDMPDYKWINTIYPSDEYTYNKLIEEYEKRDKDSNFFGYVLTMRNHIPYTKEEWAYESYGYVENNPEFDEYLSLVKDADKDLEGLINYFEQEEEKTIILFFGDHQPHVGFDKNESITKDKWLYDREVPYLLWANFDIEEKEGQDLSTNFLSLLLYEYANLDTNSYIEFLKKFKEQIPVFNSKGYKDKYGNIYTLEEESIYKNLINEYQILQYYFMFDYEIND